MQTQRKQLDFTGENIFIGMDVHKKSWTNSILVGDTFHKTMNQPPEPKKIMAYVQKNFPNANYHFGYEAGFCGYWIYEQLKSMGAACTILNPADIPTTDKERQFKEDSRDSFKIAKGLRNADSSPIFVHTQELRDLRGLARQRHQIVKDQTKCKNRIKALLNFHGIKMPADEITKHWSKRYINWLNTISFNTPEAKQTMKNAITQLQFTRQLLLEITRSLRKISQGEPYKETMKQLRSIPGIGLISAMHILTELGPIERFKSLDKLCSYFGLIPNTYSSGEKQRTGRNTKRGNKILKNTLIESSWVALRHDPALLLAYKQLCKRMEPNKAIIKIARKLLNRIRFVLKNKTEYEIRTV